MLSRHLTRAASYSAILLIAASVSACRDEAPMEPVAISAHGAQHTAAPERGLLATLTAFVGRVLDTPLGAQPRITPSLRIASPSSNGRVVANQPITIRVRYENFDNRPELRTAPADVSLGSLPQVLTDGYVQGHVHGYLQRIDDDDNFPDVNATSFCVLTRVVTRVGYNGVAEGECPAVPAGKYRLSVEFQTNSHTAILKDGPRATPTSDIAMVRVR